MLWKLWVKQPIICPEYDLLTLLSFGVMYHALYFLVQDLVEKVMVLRKAVEVSRGTSPAVSGGALADKLSQYAGLLAAQGSLTTALTYLNNSSDVSP